MANPRFQRRTDDLLGASSDLSAGPSGAGLFGLSAGFPKMVEVPLAEIERGRHQPRHDIDPEGVAALAASIARNGLLNPILVRREGERYVLIGGERRLRACEQLGRPTIFAVIVKGDPDELSLIDNIQRQDLNAVEIAGGLARLLEAHGYTHEELGAIAGMSRVSVTRLLRVLDLPPDLLIEFEAARGAVSRSALEEIAATEGDDERRRLWRLVQGGATVRALKEAKKRPAPRPAAAPAPRPGAVTRGLRIMLRLAGALKVHRSGFGDPERQALLTLRAEIDALLEEGGAGGR